MAEPLEERNTGHQSQTQLREEGEEEAMTTNLLMTIIVTLSTNVMEQFPTVMMPGPYPTGTELQLLARFHSEPVKDPKEKWVTTNVVEITGFGWILNGEVYTHKVERPLTNWTTHFVLEEASPKWVASTNQAPPKPMNFFP
jgi:hypothetical protein